MVVFFFFSSLQSDLFLNNHRMVAQPKPVATLICECGFGRDDRKSLPQRPSCQVIKRLASLAAKQSPSGQSQPTEGRKWKSGEFNLIFSWSQQQLSVGLTLCCIIGWLICLPVNSSKCKFLSSRGQQQHVMLVGPQFRCTDKIQFHLTVV